MDIKFHYNAKTNLRQRQLLKSFIADIFKREKTKASSLAIVFCDDQYLLDINTRFLGHHYFTDIITFNYNTNGSGVEGEIYISVDTVRKNADLYGVSIQHELHRVIFHGVIHLCGYRDKTKAEHFKMRQKEDYYLNSYFNGVS